MLFTSKGVAGVAGAGFVALTATLPTLGILPVAGLTLLLGVERFMSEIRAVTNLFSNILPPLWSRNGWANSTMSACAVFWIAADGVIEGEDTVQAKVNV